MLSCGSSWQPTTEALHVISGKQHTLHLRFEEELETATRRVTSTTASVAIDIASLLQVRWQALL